MIKGTIIKNGRSIIARENFRAIDRCEFTNCDFTFFNQKLGRTHGYKPKETEVYQFLKFVNVKNKKRPVAILLNFDEKCRYTGIIARAQIGIKELKQIENDLLDELKSVGLVRELE